MAETATVKAVCFGFFAGMMRLWHGWSAVSRPAL